jgi:hypothetical protein
MIGPGHMIAGHKELETKCLNCHVPFQNTSNQLCVNCHKVQDIGVLTTKGYKFQAKIKTPFHHLLIKEECTSCHVGHVGHIQITNNKGVKKFSHELLSENVRNNCSSCHQKPNDSIHLNVQNNCSSCHGMEKWKPASLNHEKYFRLDDNHPGNNCSICHIDKNNYKKYTCYGCHEHSESKIINEHQEEGIRDISNCVRCHRSGSEHNSEGGGEGRNGQENEREDDD